MRFWGQGCVSVQGVSSIGPVADFISHMWQAVTQSPNVDAVRRKAVYVQTDVKAIKAIQCNPVILDACKPRSKPNPTGTLS